MSPYVIIISGDLTDDGLIFQFQQARTLVQKLTCPKLIVFPGNHDYGHTVYLLFKRFFPFSNQVNEFDNLIILVLGTARPDRDEGEVGIYKTSGWKKSLGSIKRKQRLL